MSRLTSQYPERVYSSSAESEKRSLAERLGPRGISTGWLIGGLAVLGLGAWMAYRFGPDLVRYVKMERM